MAKPWVVPVQEWANRYIWKGEGPWKQTPGHGSMVCDRVPQIPGGREDCFLDDIGKTYSMKKRVECLFLVLYKGKPHLDLRATFER